MTEKNEGGNGESEVEAVVISFDSRIKFAIDTIRGFRQRRRQPKANPIIERFARDALQDIKDQERPEETDKG